MTFVKFRRNEDMHPWVAMNKVFRNMCNDEDWPGYNQSWAPAVDISEKDEAVFVRAEVPGMNKEDIKLTVHDGTLTISGEKKQEKTDEKENYYRTERSFGSFCRTFSLPTSINSGEIKANYKEGILMVELPKVEEAKPKEIAIDVN